MISMRDLNEAVGYGLFLIPLGTETAPPRLARGGFLYSR